VFQRASIGLAAAVLCLPEAAQARAPVVLAPVKPWNLHYAENSCQLFRTFGDPAKPTTLVLEQIAPDTPMTMMVYGGVLSARVGSGKAQASFLPFADHRFEEGEVTQVAESGQTALMWTAVDLLAGWPKEPGSDAPDRKRDVAKGVSRRTHEQSTGARITGIEVKEPRGRTTVLQTGPLAKAHAMMRQCGREQMKAWGLDPETQDKIVLSAWAKRNLVSFFDWTDYPTDAVRSGQQSIISARLIVGADGKVTNCTPLTAFIGEGFKEVVCRNLSKATFEPAELADGTRVPTFVTTRIAFRMP
jgi:hypothetical protein